MNTEAKTQDGGPVNHLFTSKTVQTLCEIQSGVFAVQNVPDCENANNLGPSCQPPAVDSGSYSPNHGIYCAKLPLKGGGFAVIDAADLGLVQGHKWRAQKSHSTSYAISGTGLLMHRLILGIHTMGREVEVDHIDGDGLNNRRANIRATTRSVNLQNRAAYGVSGRKGVKRSANGKRWCARIYHNGKPILLGTHDTKEQACAAYDKMAKALFGPQARVNTLPFPTTQAA